MAGIPSSSLLGLVGQGLDGRKKTARGQLYAITDITATPGSPITVQYTGYVDLFAWGGGGSGRCSSGAGAGGGAGADGIRRRMRVVAGQQIVATIGAGGAGQGSADTNGNAGGDTTIAFPDGLVGIARGGPGGGTTATGVGGYVITGDMTGAHGGAGGANSGNGTAGDDGGGSGAAAQAGSGGGGGAAGFASYVTGLTPGSATASIPGLSAGSNGGISSAASNNGGAGRLLIYFTRD